MTDTQILTLALVFVASIGSIVYNSSRITDLRTDLNSRFSGIDKRIDDLRDSVNRHIDDKFNLLDQKLDHIIEMLVNHRERISKLEGRG